MKFKLDPCPFCKSSNVAVVGTSVKCSDCGGEGLGELKPGALLRDVFSAVDAWNAASLRAHGTRALGPAVTVTKESR